MDQTQAKGLFTGNLSRKPLFFPRRTQCFLHTFPPSNGRLRPRDFPFGKDTMHKTPPSWARISKSFFASLAFQMQAVPSSHKEQQSTLYYIPITKDTTLQHQQTYGRVWCRKKDVISWCIIWGPGLARKPFTDCYSTRAVHNICICMYVYTVNIYIYIHKSNGVVIHFHSTN